MTETVIIAVSDPHILYLLQRYAEEAGYRAIGTPPGRDLAALLAQQPAPSLVILDWESPGTARHNAMAELRCAAAARGIPVLIYPGLDEPVEDGEEGVAGYLPASVMYPDFVLALQRAGLSLNAAL